MNSVSGRRLVLLGVVGLGLGLLLVGVARYLLPGQELAGRIATAVNEATGAELEPGRVRLKLLGGVGLHLASGRLQGDGAELARRTGAGRGLGAYRLSYTDLRVTVDPMALLRRRVVVRRLEIAGPGWEVATPQGPLRGRDYTLALRDLQCDLDDAGAAATGAPGDRIPASLQFALRVGIAELTVPGASWREVRLAGRAQRRRLDVSRLTASLADGSLEASGALDFASDVWGRADWKLRLAGVPSGELLRPWWPEVASRLSCALDGEASGSLSLRDAATRRATLLATGHLAGAAGVLRAADWLREAQPYLGSRRDLTTIRFDRLEHAFAVREGRYEVTSLTLDGPDTDWQAAGWLAFAGDMRLRIGVLLPAGFTPDLGAMSFLAETMRNDEGRVQLGFTLSGAVAAPQLGLDLGSLRGGR